MRFQWIVLALGAAAFAVACALAPSHASDAISTTWHPFVLVAGLLLVGLVANENGLFDALARRLAHAPGGDTLFVVGGLLLVAIVAALLNLDTAAAFLTPVLLLGVRHRGTDDQRLLYGTLLMCNAGSLLLPGSNLTNLLVLSAQHQSVTGFARQMWPAFAAAVGVTIVVVVCSPRRHRGGGVLRGAAPAATFVTTRSGIGTAVVATTAALVCMLTLGDPAPAVAAIGALAVALEMARRRVTPARVVDAVDPAVLVGLFGIATALGVLGRSWHWPSSVLASANPGGTAAIAVGTSVALNNLPAAALLAARPVAHAHALLVGLDLGPNLAVTGSLSALLWYRTARAAGARPRVGHISKIGVILAPLSIAAALLALHFLSSGIV